MVVSTTPKPTPADFPALDALASVGSFAVALSGGADSTALLLACAARWPDRVRAIHINHGLQTAAAEFEAHCVRLCDSLQLPLWVVNVDARHQSGQSPEEAARQARYQALSECALAHGLTHIALAQHADDQVETLLLALSRGAGLPGLAAMPAQFERFGVTYHRPWLQVPGQALRDALVRVGQTWVQDPTNDDTQFTRNRIRAEVLPVLDKAFPSFRQTFARSAAHAAQAQTLLQELAEQDALQVGLPPNIQQLQQLSSARQTNVLRHWLAQAHMQASAAQMQALLVQVQACTTRGHRIDIKVGRGFVRRDGAVLRCYNL
jgi:tRNA(Ile)-lysidine synthase